jgi:PTH2 family peptidyl-tRNA hydrolase
MVKQVIVMRKDLRMRKGKIASQAAHASMKVLLEQGSPHEGYYRIPMTPYISEWLGGIFTKICLAVNSEEELDEIYRQAKEACLPVAMIVDNGTTVFNGIKTKTCLAIGPMESEDIDEITGKLSLF